MSRFAFLAIHVVLIFVSIIVIAQIFPLIHYFGGFYFSVEKSDIEKRALSIIWSLYTHETVIMVHHGEYLLFYFYRDR
jgi:hypothetical protein